MVRTITDRMYDKTKHYSEFAGLSTDTKPVSKLVTGSIFLEIDTGSVYLYNEAGAAGHKWVEIGGQS